MRQFAVVGSPIEHSLSPTLHQAVFDQLGIEAAYAKREVLQGELANSVFGLSGVSVTMPLKVEAFDLARTHDEFAKATGVVNTLIADGDGFHGFNTDVPGLTMIFADRGLTICESVTVIGNGATARSVIAAVRPLTRTIRVMARSHKTLSEVDQEIGWSEPLDSEVVVSTVPEGAADQLTPGTGLFIDLLYKPWPTPLASRWGGEVVSGIEMLINQAALQSQLFLAPTGVEVEEVRQIMRQAL